MRRLTFPIQMTPEAEGGYSVSCPLLPGCYSQGDTLEEARANMREAITLTLQDMVEHGEALPDPDAVLHASLSVEV